MKSVEKTIQTFLRSVENEMENPTKNGKQTLQWIECEIRGPVKNNKVGNLILRLQKKWKKLDGTSEVIVFFKDRKNLRFKLNKNYCSVVAKWVIENEASRRESEMLFPVKKTLEVMNTLQNNGYKRGVLSYCKRWNGQNKTSNVSLLVGTRMGNFFELEKKEKNPKNIKKTIQLLTEVAKQEKLKTWTEKKYKKLVQNVWAKTKPETLMSGASIHPLILRVLQENQNSTYDN